MHLVGVPGEADMPLRAGQPGVRAAVERRAAFAKRRDVGVQYGLAVDDDLDSAVPRQ